MLKKDEAVCIRTVDYSETSQVLTFFCSNAGKISAIAKGSRRAKSPFGGPIEVFSHGQIVYVDHAEGKLSTLTEFERRGDFTSLRRRLDMLNSALFGAELVNSLTTDRDPHPEVYEAFVRFIGDLESVTSREDSLRLLIVFQLGLLGRLGMGLVLEGCANCKDGFGTAWPQVFFSSEAHGLVCMNCEGSFADRIKLSNPAGECLSNLKLLAPASQKVLAEVEKTIIYHFTAVLHHPPRMAKYISQL
jgi:DNA repair protein RecO (recombination protein O)